MNTNETVDEMDMFLRAALEAISLRFSINFVKNPANQVFTFTPIPAEKCRLEVLLWKILSAYLWIYVIAVVAFFAIGWNCYFDHKPKPGLLCLVVGTFFLVTAFLHTRKFVLPGEPILAVQKIALSWKRYRRIALNTGFVDTLATGIAIHCDLRTMDVNSPSFDEILFQAYRSRSLTLTDKKDFKRVELLQELMDVIDTKVPKRKSYPHRIIVPM